MVLGQGQADDVDVEPLDGALHGGAPPAADVEQGHARLEVQFVQVEVDLGVLGLFQGHVVALEVGAAVDPGRVLEQAEEVVGDVVMRLDVLRTRPRLRRAILVSHCDRVNDKDVVAVTEPWRCAALQTIAGTPLNTWQG